jgi:ABC-type transport system involved in multi-copper enzyme maturation permease subunit
MNKTIAKATIRYWLKMPLVISGILFLFGIYLAQCVMSYVSLQGVGHETRWLELSDPLALVLVLGTGIIGRDITSGLLPLILARPVTRAEYVLTKWLTLSIAASLITIIELTVVHGWFLFWDRSGIANLSFLAQVGTAIFTCTGLAAVIVMFSALRPGPFAGTGLWLILYSLVRLMESLGKQNPANPGPHADPTIVVVFDFFNNLKPLVATLAVPLRDFIANTLSFTDVLQDNAIHWLPLGIYFFNLTLVIVLAIHIVNRKELGYGTQ